MQYFGLGYMISDEKNADIGSIEGSINSNLGEFGISNFRMVFPGFSHVAIEGMQSQVERSILLFLIPTHSFPEGKDKLGSLEISKGLTLNNALNVYSSGNSSRMMAIGGTPGVVIYYKDKSELPLIKDMMQKALSILADKIDAEEARSNEVHNPKITQAMNSIRAAMPKKLRILSEKLDAQEAIHSFESAI